MSILTELKKLTKKKKRHGRISGPSGFSGWEWKWVWWRRCKCADAVFE